MRTPKRGTTGTKTVMGQRIAKTPAVTILKASCIPAAMEIVTRKGAKQVITSKKRLQAERNQRPDDYCDYYLCLLSCFIEFLRVLLAFIVLWRV